MSNPFDITINGNNSNQRLTGANNSNDLILGRDGDDIIRSGSGDDVLLGGDGVDSIRAGSGDDIIDPGTSVTTTSRPYELISGGDGNDTLAFNLENHNDVDHVDINLGAADAADVAGIPPTQTQYSISTAYTDKNGEESFEILAHSIENVIGTHRDDTITGDYNANTLVGRSGDDTIEGASGDDAILGEAGNDLLYGGKGNDVLLAGSGLSELLDGGEGNDILDPGTARDVLVHGGEGNDTLAYDLNFDNRSASTVVYSDEHITDTNLVTGKASFTSSTGYTGNVRFDGVENVTGTVFHDRITGDSGNNVLIGGRGTDVIRGGAGDDVLAPGQGATSVTLANGKTQVQDIDGGTGNDTIAYNDFRSVNIDLESGETTATSVYANNNLIAADTAGSVSHKITSIENVIGAAGDDNIKGDTNNNVLNGGTGSDKIDGRAGDDVLIGGRGIDELDGGEGNDTLSFVTEGIVGVKVDLSTETSTTTFIDPALETAKIAHDVLGIGEPVTSITIDETDTVQNIENVIGSAGNDTLTGDANNNSLLGGEGDDTLSGGEGNDIIAGNEGNDTLNGGDGDDYLFAGEGADEVNGDAGDDSITLSNNTGNMLDGGEGNDQLSFDATFNTGVTVDLQANSVAADDQSIATVKNIEQVLGTASNDSLSGDKNSNVLHGGAGTNQISGRGGNDIILDHGSRSTLNGGAGNDSIIISGDVAEINGGKGTDTLIVDDTAHTATGVTIDLSNSALTDNSGTTTVRGIENVAGTMATDTITGTDVDNILSGQGGDDVLNGLAGNDQLFLHNGIGEAHGGAGNDFLAVSGTNNKYLTKAPLLDGGAGDDVFFVSNVGGTHIEGGAGNDTVILQGNFSDYDVFQEADGSLSYYSITHGDKNISNVESVQFTETGLGEEQWFNYGSVSVSTTNVAAISRTLAPEDLVVFYNVPADVTIDGAVRGAQASNGTYTYTIPAQDAYYDLTVISSGDTEGVLSSIGVIGSPDVAGLDPASIESRQDLRAEVVITKVEAPTAGSVPSAPGSSTPIDTTLPDLPETTENQVTAELYGQTISGSVGEEVSAHLVIGTDGNQVALTAEAAANANGDITIAPGSVTINGEASVGVSAGYVSVANIGGFATVSSSVTASADVSAAGSFSFSQHGLEASAQVQAGVNLTSTSSIETDYADIVISSELAANAEAGASLRLTDEGIGYHAGASAYAGITSSATVATENEVISASAGITSTVSAKAGAEVSADVNFTEDNIGGTISSGAYASAGSAVTAQGELSDGEGIASARGSVGVSGGASVGASGSITAEYEDGSVTLGISGGLAVIAGVQLGGSVTIDYVELGESIVDVGEEVIDGLEDGLDYVEEGYEAVENLITDTAEDIADGITTTGGEIVEFADNAIDAIGDFISNPFGIF